MKLRNLLLVFFGLTFAFSYAQTESQRIKITQNYDLIVLGQLEAAYEASFMEEKQQALALATSRGWSEFIDLPNGGQAELVGVFPTGEPKYYATDNREGGITTRTNRVHTGGTAGLDLNGEGMVPGVWDGGRVRETHQLLEGRPTQIDGTTSISDHATHVAGTMVGTGDVNGGAAKGMAPEATLDAYSFNNDESEMTAAAAGGMLVSNHSYGIRATSVPLWYLGYYDSNARNMDNIVYNAPYYLPVCSAGNDRQSGANTTDGGYDYLTDKSVAKNAIICAAVNEVLNYTGPTSVGMSSFSSWGPTDDGRIKPDISAKGVNMLSSTGSSNSSYGNFSGTSMATPNTSGSLVLLQQYYNDLNGNFMLSSTLRGLALHTADEAGTTPGPDYRFGWGLLNTERAAEVIANNGSASIIMEESLAQGATFNITVQSDNINDLMASITWTDPAGTVPPTGNNDAFIPALVNDLDIRVTEVGGATFSPWKLDPANFTAAATTGDNIVDNIEKVEIGSASGSYVIEVTHKGTLTNGPQMFSLIVTGIVTNFSYTVVENSKEICSDDVATESFDVDVDFADGFTDTVTFTTPGLPAGVTATVTPTTLSADGSLVVDFDGLDGLAPGEYAFELLGTSAGDTNSTLLKLFVFDSDLPATNLLLPVDEAIDQELEVDFDWDAILPALNEYEFELATDDAFTTIVASETTADSSTTISGLLNETEYFWRVRGVNDCGDGEYSVVFSFTTEEILGINENLIQGLSVYPNPASSILNITADTNVTSVEILNILGQTLITQSVEGTSAQVNVAALSSGNYFVRVQTADATSVVQIVKK